MDFGFWSLEFGVWSLDFGFWILDFGSWILDFGFWILGFGFWILDLGFWILDFGSWILDFGYRILDFGFWIVVVSVLYVAAPNAAVWILDFGFWQRFGFCIRLLLLHADSGRRIILIRSLCLLCTAFVHLRSCNSARAEIKAMSGGLGKRIS